MNKKIYETPVIMEYEMLSEQTFLQASAGASTESYSQQTSYDSNPANSIWR